MNKHVLVTGGAGFIGSHLVDRLLGEGWRVTVVDNFDPFYDPAIKERNVAPHLQHDAYTLHRIDIRDMDGLRERLTDEYDVIVHLAAKAGVRPSIEDPITYQEVNVAGTQNMLEFARGRAIKQFEFASSSSVYGRYEVVNLGNNSTISLNELVSALERALMGKATLNRLPEQPEDVPQTWADVNKPNELFGYRPQTELPQGLNLFCEWLRRTDAHVAAG